MAKRCFRLLLTANLRRLLSLVFIIGSFATTSHGQIWSENFNTYADGTMNGPPKWSSYATDCDDSGQLNQGPGQSQWGVWSGQFAINDAEGAPCCPNPPAGFGGGGNDNQWLSQVIDIEDYCDISISMQVSANGVFECDSGGAPIFGCQIMTPPDNSHDQVLIEYSLDGGGWVQLAYICGDAGVGTISTSGLNGTTLQIRFYASNKSNAEFYYVDNIVVNGTTAAVPTFNQIGPLCENDAPITLPTTSNQGINGTWTPSTFNPAGLGGSTTTIDFVPGVGQCATSTSMDIDVENAIPTVPTPMGPYCEDDAAVLLPTIVSGVNGTWSGPGVVGNNFNPGAANIGTNTITFTPAAAACALASTLDIEVTPAAVPDLDSDVMCATDAPYDLNSLEDPAYPNGTWSGTGVSGNQFDPTGQSGSVILTFTSSDACVNPATTNIIVNPANTPTISGVPASICELEAAISLPTPQDGMDGVWSGTGVSGNMFDPTGLSGVVTLTFTPNPGECGLPATSPIDVEQGSTPNISGIPASLCELASPANLPTTQGGITGNWSGPGVSGNLFDPSGQSGSVTLTFTPDAGQCANPATEDITINAPTTPVITGLPASLCEQASAVNLPTTQGGFTGDWSGLGVSGNMFDPSGQSGNVTLTFTPDAGQCANPATEEIAINAPTTPVITGLPASLCELANPANLPTTQGGFTGDWSGPGVSGNMFDPSGQSGSVTLTFTPDAGQCANPATEDIAINTPITPNITGVPASICETGANINLPTTQGGFAGSWSGQGVSGNSFDPSSLSGLVTLTFTPNTGLCANPATTDIDVQPPTEPTISGVPASLCELDNAVILPTNQSGFLGNWSGPGVSGNLFDPSGQSGTVTLTFTPNANFCATSTTAEIDVTPPITPNITGVPPTLCELDAPVNLPTNQSGIEGTWSGQGVNNNFFDPNGFNGPVALTFTPNAGECANNATESITVTPSIEPTIDGVPASICEIADPFQLPSSQSGINGDWSGTGVFSNTFDPSGLSGTITLTFTPEATACATPVTTTIEVGTGGAPNISDVPNSICETSPPIDLPTVQEGIMGNWSGQGVINNIFNPIGLSGSILLTFTPDAAFCANDAIFTIEVGNGGAPIITGIPANICQSAQPIALPTTQGAMTGTWSGQGVVNNNFNPAGLSGNITLTFTPDASFCASNATNVIAVGNGGTPAITGVPVSLCETAQAIALPTTQGGMTGTWSGQGVTNNSFDPNGLSGTITLTFTPAPSFCASSATTNISVGTGPAPNISGIPATACQSEQPISLPTTQGGMTGNWSGQGVTNNSFNPSGLSGSITLTFVPDAAFCTNNATTTIAITLPTTPTLGTTSLCETAGLFILSTLNDPNYPAGNWSGPGVSGGNFDPMGQSGNVVLSFAPSANCVNQATTNVTVYAPVAPALGTASVCESDTPLDLATLANPNYSAGTWSGPGVTGGSFDPNGQSGSVNLTFTPSANCTAASMTTVTVIAAPGFSALNEPCDATNTTYNVSFTLSGGTAPYTVDGLTLTGTTFTSAPIASGDNYSFVIDDAMGCGPVMASGTENCLCATDAGTMNIGNTTLVVCYLPGVPFSAVYNFDQMLDGDDALQFVLHDNPGATLGNVFATSNSPVILMPNNLIMGQTYYVSAVAGNAGANGINLNDDCLSVSQGYPVQFYLPAVSFGPDAEICASECYDMPLYFTGNPPFLMDYQVEINGQFYIGFADNLSDGSSIEICPALYGLTEGTLTFTVLGFSDSNNCALDFSSNPNPPSSTITVGSSVSGSLSSTLCPGESLVVNGTVYDEANPSGTQLFPGASFSGCDSLVNMNLTFYPPATGNIIEEICAGQVLNINGTIYDQNNLTGTEILAGAALHGCDSTIYINLTLVPSPVFNLTETLCTGGSVTVNGTVYDETNPIGTETIFGGATNGCDSTINVNLSFNSVVTENIVQTLCPGESLIVNGQVYDESNPSGTETMPNGSVLGCDSIANVNLSFYPPSVYNYSQTLCTGGSVIINGTVYDASNPTGTEVIIDGSFHGCDSTINISLSFNSVVTENVTPILCEDESITVNGTIYDVSNPTGTETIPNGSYLGCDSAIVVNLSFYPPATDTLDDQLCIGGSMIVNGTVYDESNPTGTEVIQNATINGCDSTIFVNLTFGNSVIVSLDETLCPGEVLFINGTMYSASNPTGSETFPMASYLGCDSTINISLSFYQEAVGNITEILQSGGSIVVNGTVYDEQNPTGVEVFTGASFFGCDSTVIVSLTFGTGNAISAITQVNSPLCQFGNDGSIVIENIIGGTPPYIVAMNGSNSAPVVSFPFIFDNLSFGFHTLTILDATGTVSQQEIFMPDAPPFEVDLGGLITLQLGENVVLNAETASQIVSWAWSPPDYLDCTDCPSPTSTPLEDINYGLTVIDINGCTSESEVQVIVEKVQEVFVPNAFTPNNDGINDELTVFASPQVERVVGFQIFSRWGELVYAQFDFPPNDLQFGWNGSFKGERMDPAVFAWVAEIRFLDGQTRLFKGDVTLVR